MTGWSVDQLLEATAGQLVTGGVVPSEGREPSEAHTAPPILDISIDSRRLQPGEAYLAIRGPRFDGHTFIPEAVERGAACVIAAKAPATALPIPLILVEDTTKALGALAAFHRRRFNIPVIAVTGSCGKTTTKELIAHLLDQWPHDVLKTNGTENNHIGLPLTLLRLRNAHQLAVVELGSNHPGEIAYLAHIAKPTVAVITNVGPTHLEFFDGVDAVRHEKLSLLEALDVPGWAVVPGDQLEVLLEAKARVRPETTLLTFGTTSQCGVQALDVRRDHGGMSMRLRDVVGEFSVPMPGVHNMENTVAALACMKALGLPLELFSDPLRQFRQLPLRSEVVQCQGMTVINDCYNANPLSFARALEMLKTLEVRRRVVIAGDMLELGSSTGSAHQAIGWLACQLGIDLIVAVGAYAEEVARGVGRATAYVNGGCGNGPHPRQASRSQTITYRTVQELLQQLPGIVRAGDGVLIKGSRRLRMEQVAEFLQATSDKEPERLA